MKIKFNEPVPASMTYAYSWRFDETPVFTQGEDCIENRPDPAGPAGYEFITVLTKEKYPPGSAVSTECAFEDIAAPLIVLAKDVEEDSRGVLRYGEYIEVVLWKNGVNVWRMWMIDGKVTWKKLMGIEFSAAETVRHRLTVETRTDGITVTADERKMHLCIPDFYDTFHAGINACEGICRFWDFSVE